MVLIDSIDNINIKGSNLDVANDLSLGTFTIAKNADGSLKTNDNGTFETVSGIGVLGGLGGLGEDSIKNVNISSATLRSEHWEEHKSSSINPVAVVKDVAKKAVKAATKAIDKVQNLATKVAGATGIEPLEKLVSLENKIVDKEQGYVKDHITDPTAGANNAKSGALINKTESKSSSSTTTQASSNINVGGNLMMNTSEENNAPPSFADANSFPLDRGNITIKASNINIGGNALINTGGDLLITSVAETGNSSQKDQDIQIGELTGGFKDNSLQAGVKGTGTSYEEQQQASTQKSSNINIGGSMLANVGSNAGGSSPCSGGSGCASIASAEQGGNLNISGGNLLAKNMILNVGNNLNVESKQTQWY